MFVITNRPISITVLSWLFIVFGAWGFLFNYALLRQEAVLAASESFSTLSPAWPTYLYPNHWYSDMHPLVMWLFPAQWLFLAVCGVFMRYGFNLARWMLVAWVSYHSFQTLAHTRFELMFEIFTYIHSPWESVVQLHLFIAILYTVFRPEAGRYFRGERVAV